MNAQSSLITLAQVVLVPVDLKACAGACADVARRLAVSGIRAHVDDRDWLTPGRKYYHWERRVRALVDVCLSHVHAS